MCDCTDIVLVTKDWAVLLGDGCSQLGSNALRPATVGQGPFSLFALVERVDAYIVAVAIFSAVKRSSQPQLSAQITYSIADPTLQCLLAIFFLYLLANYRLVA